MKFCIIGLGRFGYQVASSLAEHGMDVIGVDNHESIIDSIKDRITQPICMQINDEEDLKSIGADEVDTVIVAMGDFAQSILITALLKRKLKVPKVITRSLSPIHKEILNLVGADQVVLPEQEVAIRLADTLSLPFKSLIQITPEFGISQIQAKESLVGSQVKDIEENYQVKCIAKKTTDEVLLISESYVIKAKDNLIISGNNRNLAKIAKL